MSTFAEVETWVLVSFLLFCAVLVYYGVPQLITKALDARELRIKAELDEARRLREDAQKLLEDYKRRSREAEEEARAIIEQAQRESQALALETRRTLKEQIERQTKLAEEKIARAEAQAVTEVRATAVDVALSAAEKILRERTVGAKGADLIDQGIRDLRGKLN